MSDRRTPDNARKRDARRYRQARPGTNYTTAAREGRWLIEVGRTLAPTWCDVSPVHVALADFAAGVCVIAGRTGTGRFNLQEVLAEGWKEAGAQIVVALHPHLSLSVDVNKVLPLSDRVLSGPSELAGFLAKYRPGDVPVVVFADELESGGEDLFSTVDSRGLYIVNLIGAHTETAWSLGTICAGRPTRITLTTGMGTPDEHHALMVSMHGVGGRPVRFLPRMSASMRRASAEIEPVVSASWNLNLAGSDLTK
ncbi:hypothetical protein PP352_21450 [Mycobacteroides abscessus]|nr:hypothetical protein [Mycobacteroides abscessus]